MFFIMNVITRGVVALVMIVGVLRTLLLAAPRPASMGAPGFAMGAVLRPLGVPELFAARSIQCTTKLNLNPHEHHRTIFLYSGLM